MWRILNTIIREKLFQISKGTPFGVFLVVRLKSLKDKLFLVLKFSFSLFFSL